MNGWMQEWRLTSREPVFRWATTLLLVLTALCLANGYHFKLQRDHAAQDELQRSFDKQTQDIRTVEAEAAGTMPVNPWGASEPSKASWNATRPSGPLAFLSFGEEDIAPLSANVSLWMVREDNLFRKYEFGSPLALVAGRFDAGFLVILLLPLFVLALTYNVVAEERRSGRLRLALMQGDGVSRRMAMRMVLRLLPVYLTVAIIAVAGTFWTEEPMRLLLWCGAAVIYLIAWSTLAMWLATLRKPQEMLALFAGGLWLGIAVLLPALGAMIAESASPSRSEFELINDARASSLEANRHLLDNLRTYVEARPGLMADAPTNDDWAAKLYVSQRVIEADLQSLMQAREDADGLRQAWASRLSYLSPVFVTDRLLGHIAGTDHARQDAFEKQVVAYLHQWRDAMDSRVFQRERMTKASLESLPQFDFMEQPLRQERLVYPFLYLLAVAVAFGVWARRRLQALTRGQ